MTNDNETPAMQDGLQAVRDMSDTGWTIGWYECRADADDVKHAAKIDKSISVGDILWRAPTSIGPIFIDHNHWGGYLLSCDEKEAYLIAAAPDLYHALENLIMFPGDEGATQYAIGILSKARGEHE